MRNMILGALFCGFGFFVGTKIFNEQSVEEILGTTYSELSSMKRECELVIPRNQECVASIVFLPTVIEE